ncbi:hypothetical protein IFM89_019576 [Coptis chinensis]|uniref:Uncharacterized protein n=1 Tax=Coptis chinensis TaxID=261450 RepID=A0A835LM45_9MAGN|nr:hypothetical protein IFM89_019576 [Coptis chinensis]
MRLREKSLDKKLSSIEYVMNGPFFGSQSLSSILAVLPSGVHGLSPTGLPSPLLSAGWRSGGSCDCGEQKTIPDSRNLGELYSAALLVTIFCCFTGDDERPIEVEEEWRIEVEEKRETERSSDWTEIVTKKQNVQRTRLVNNLSYTHGAEVALTLLSSLALTGATAFVAET